MNEYEKKIEKEMVSATAWALTKITMIAIPIIIVVVISYILTILI